MGSLLIPDWFMTSVLFQTQPPNNYDTYYIPWSRSDLSQEGKFQQILLHLSMLWSSLKSLVRQQAGNCKYNFLMPYTCNSHYPRHLGKLVTLFVTSMKLWKIFINWYCGEGLLGEEEYKVLTASVKCGLLPD